MVCTYHGTLLPYQEIKRQREQDSHRAVATPVRAQGTMTATPDAETVPADLAPLRNMLSICWSWGEDRLHFSPFQEKGSGLIWEGVVQYCWWSNTTQNPFGTRDSVKWVLFVMCVFLPDHPEAFFGGILIYTFDFKCLWEQSNSW